MISLRTQQISFILTGLFESVSLPKTHKGWKKIVSIENTEILLKTAIREGLQAGKHFVLL